MTAAAHLHEAAKPATAQELNAVLRRLKDAASRGRTPTYDERIDALTKLERAVLARKDPMVQAISRDFGHRSPHETLIAEVFVILGAIKYTKAHLREWMQPDDRETGWMFLPSTCQVIHQPVGVVGIISPWNYPVQLALVPLIAALAAGNRVMIKPSELVPETAEFIRDLIATTYPEDLVAVVTGGPEVGEAFTKLPFDHLLFTGSTRVGKAVMRAASENLVPVTLELGGKSPAIIAGDFSARVAAERIMAGKTLNAGQTCIAPDYVMVPPAMRDAFIEGCKDAVGRMFPTLAANPDYTSIVNDKHYARVQSYIQDARDRGAKVIELNTAGEPLDPRTRKIAPTLVLDPPEDALCMQEEIFGPVLPIRTYDRLDDAIAYVNDHPRPLALYYFGHARAEVDRVLSETVSGGVTVNETTLHFAQDDLPFGGAGASGMGHYHAREGFETLSKKKAVFRQSRIDMARLMRPPYGKTLDRLLALFVGK